MSKSKFEEYLEGAVMPDEWGTWLQAMALQNWGPLKDGMQAQLQLAFEAGMRAQEEMTGMPASKLRKGDLFRKVSGKQVYIMMSSEHLNIIDFHQRRLAVNAKGNPIKLGAHERVVRCEEKEFFAAKDLP